MHTKETTAKETHLTCVLFRFYCLTYAGTKKKRSKKSQFHYRYKHSNPSRSMNKMNKEVE